AIWVFGLCSAMIGVALFGCTSDTRNDAQANQQPGPATAQDVGSKPGLAQYYEPHDVEFTANASGYQLPLDPSKVVNESALRRLSTEAQQLLGQNGFVVTAAGPKEDMADVYDDIEGSNMPVYVTADSLLHVYHIQFDETLKDIEEREFYDDLVTLSRALRDDSRTKYRELSGDLKEAAGRNWAFFFVGWLLLNPLSSEGPSQSVYEQCRAELQLIEAHQGFAASPLFKYKGGLLAVCPARALHAQRGAEALLQG
ncbi:unnamed protein product, partial [marine sediment metagenome]